MVYLTEKWHDFLQVQEVGRVRPPAATSWHLRVPSHLPRPSPGHEATKPYEACPQGKSSKILQSNS